MTSIDNTRLVVTHKDDVDQNNLEQENESNRSDSRPNSRSSLTLAPRRTSSSSVESVRNKTGDENMMPPPKIIPMNRRRPPIPVPLPPVPTAAPEAGSDLYEGLKRMTRGRLDDQRGLEINTELPEFLRKSGGLESRVSEPYRPDTGSRSAMAASRLSGPAGYLGKFHISYFSIIICFKCCNCRFTFFRLG